MGSATAPKLIRIEDLARPELTAAQREAVAFADGLEIDFAPGAVVAEAMRRCRLDDFGPGGWEGRLAAMTTAVDADEGLSGLGRLILHRRLVGLLAARLRLEDYLRRWPEANDVELEPPVIVVGLPRSGTTHLVNLLATDRRLRALPWWECREPVPAPGDGPGPDGMDPRHLRCLTEYEIETELTPLLAAMHDRRPDAIEEECELLDLDFASYTLEWHARVPYWRDVYLGLHQDAHYGYLVKILKVLTHLRGPSRWVLKSPQHLEQLGPLTRSFPGATIVFTARDPVAVIQSTVTMLAYGDRLRRHDVDLDGLARYWVDRIEGLLRASIRDRHLVRSDQIVEVPFHTFMDDETQTTESILDHAGLGCPPDVRSAIENYRDNHPRGAHGRIHYDLAGQFGIDPDRLRRRFAFYFDAHPDVVAETGSS